VLNRTLDGRHYQTLSACNIDALMAGNVGGIVRSVGKLALRH
jgi:hypothetical protein